MRVDDHIDADGLVDEKPQSELVAGHGQEMPIECLDFATEATIVGNDQVRPMRERSRGDMPVLVIHGRDDFCGCIAFVESVK